MTATARQVRTGHWADAPANDSKFPEPQDPAIKTKADVAQAVIVWVGGTFFSLAIIAALAKAAPYVIAYIKDQL